MNVLEILIVIGGVLHWGTLLGSAQVPRELGFREELPKLPLLLRQWVLVAGGYVVFNLVAFGALAILFAPRLASGEPLARGLCAYIALYWLVRLAIQWFVFDAKAYLRAWWLKAGYHGLTLVFIYHTLVFGYAAIAP